MKVHVLCCEGTRTYVKDDEAKRSVPKEDEGYDVVPLKTPVYREDLPGRPTLRDGTLHDDTRREGTRNDVQLRRTTDGCVRKETTIPNNRRTSYAYIGFIHKVHQAANAFLTIHIGTIHIVSQAPGARARGIATERWPEYTPDITTAAHNHWDSRAAGHVSYI